MTVKLNGRIDSSNAGTVEQEYKEDADGNVECVDVPAAVDWANGSRIF